MRPYILVASYPKSGNTWTRIVFERLMRGVDLSINAMDNGLGGGARRRIFDRFAPADASDLLTDEIVEFHPAVYRQFAETANANGNERVFVKAHEIARLNGNWMYPPESIDSVVYLVRHPFDVAVSSANHFGRSIKMIVDFMADESAMPLATSWLPGVVPMPYGTWSENVTSWLDAKPYRLEWARYEDLYADPLQHFERLACAIGLSPSHTDLTRVIEASRFEVLQKEEEAQGFRERPNSSSVFFRAGHPGSWQGILSRELQEKIVRDHGPLMDRLGYAADGGVRPLPRE